MARPKKSVLRPMLACYAFSKGRPFGRMRIAAENGHVRVYLGCRSLVTVVLLLAQGFGAPAAELDSIKAEELRLVPFPKKIAIQPGRFSLKPSLILEVPENQGKVLGQLLNDELKRAGLPEARVRILDSKEPAFRLAPSQRAIVLPTLVQTNSPETYALVVRAEEIVGHAREPGGLLYGLQTLCQL